MTTSIALAATVDQIRSLVANCKKERTCVNAGVLDQKPDSYKTWYGRPTVVMMDSEWNNIDEWVWDHTAHQLEEAAEVAAMNAGVVSLRYPIILADVDCPESGKEIDDGFEIQVFPKFCLRAHNSWVDISEEEDE